MTGFWLGLIGLALALPVPSLLARAAWPRWAPAAGIALWQALALAAILAISGAALSTASWLVAGDDPHWLQITAHAALFAMGFVVWGRFWWAAWGVWRETSARRKRHRELTDMLGTPHGTSSAVRILAEQTPIAYCIPSTGGSRVVISQGTIEQLDSEALNAVLEHERAHVRRRHDVVLEAFGVLHRAFPRFLRTDAPLHQSQVLVELMADDAARRVTSDKALARAIVALAGSPKPEGTLGAGGLALIRIERLRQPITPAQRWGSAAASALLSAAVLVVPTVTLAVPWIREALSGVAG